MSEIGKATMIRGVYVYLKKTDNVWSTVCALHQQTYRAGRVDGPIAPGAAPAIAFATGLCVHKLYSRTDLSLAQRMTVALRELCKWDCNGDSVGLVEHNAIVVVL